VTVDDVGYMLDAMLADWHHWQLGFRVCPAPGADPMFRSARSGRGWDSTQDIIDGELADSTMEAIDFNVCEMADPYRSAIYAHARNLCHRIAVWSSPRLPPDPRARAVLVADARAMLAARLVRAGVVLG
jgi:hypothetical protein